MKICNYPGSGYTGTTDGICVASMPFAAHSDESLTLLAACLSQGRTKGSGFCE